MARGVKKVSKVDLYLSTVAEKVLTDFFNDARATQVEVPAHFTLDEAGQILKGVRSFKHMVYTKEAGVKTITTSNAAFKMANDKFYLVVVSK